MGQKEIIEYKIIIDKVVQTPQTENIQQSTYSAIIKLPLNAKFLVIENNQDTNIFKIATNSANEQTLASTLIKLSVPFIKSNTLIINEENIDNIVCNIMNSMSIRKTYPPTKIMFENKQLYIKIVDAIETEDEEENPQITEYFYSNCRDIDVYLYTKVFKEQDYTYEITVTGHIKQIEKYVDSFATYERISINQGTHMKIGDKIQKLNELKSYRSSIINALKKREFEDTSTEDKKKQIKDIITSLKESIELNNNKDIKRYIEDIKKYNGLKLYSSKEDNTWLLEYIKCWEEIFNNMEKHTFVSDIESPIIKRMHKCPYCDIYSNDISNLQNHITFTHNTKFRKDISFKMQYIY